MALGRYSSLLAMLLIGCRPTVRPTPALPAPTTLFTTDSFLGTALSGPVAGAVPIADSANALTVYVTLIALEKVPALPYAPVGSRAVFFSSSGGGDAVLPAAQFTRSSTIADLQFAEDLPATLRAGNAGRMTVMTTLRSALLPGITTDFAALDPDTVMDATTGIPTRRQLDVLVSRPTAATALPQIALILKDFVTPKDGKRMLLTEKALFDLPAGDSTNTALMVPFHFDDAASKAVAILVQIFPPTNSDSHAAATTQAIEQVAHHLAATQPALSTGEANAWSAVTAAVQSLSPVAGRRSSLAFLADETGAPICEDLAMEADDAMVGELVKSIQAKVASGPSPQSDLNVGWLLDHAALDSLDKLLNAASNGTTKMEPELSAILTAHTGEVGRHPSSLDQVLRGLNSRADLDNRLQAENTIFLEDSSPASRVRAYDWLNARHHAPAGYDPLASGRERRAALEQAAGAP